MSEWQPIEKAPKEGYILAFEQGYGIHKSWWHESDDGSGWRNPYHGWRPTHWIPLPPEPDCKDK